MRNYENRYKEKDSRDRWVHEAELVNHRLTWLGVSQGLLFTAYGLIISKSGSTATSSSAISHLPISNILEYIAAAGLALSFVVLIGVSAAHLAMFYIHKDTNYKNEIPEFGVRTHTTIMGALTAMLMPLIFMVLWFTLCTPCIATLNSLCFCN